MMCMRIFTTMFLLFLSVSIQSMDPEKQLSMTKPSEKQMTILQAAYHAHEQGDEQRSAELLRKNNCYKPYESYQAYPELVAAVIANDSSKERGLVFGCMHESGFFCD